MAAMKSHLGLVFLAIAATTVAQSPARTAPAARITIDTSKHVAEVSPTLYGLMTEEINHAYDGGLYAEMVRNRTMHPTWAGVEEWNINAQGTARGSIAKTSNIGPSTALPYSLQVTIANASAGNELGVANSGWWGYGVRPSTTYTGSFYAKPSSGITSAHIRLVADNTGATLAETTVPLTGSDWKQYSYKLQTHAGFAPGKDNHLILSFAQPGTVNLQLVSLFPPTYNNRPNGFRPDIMKLMAGMHPHFLRLPGGNYLEGDTINTRFDWKKQIGPAVDRPTHAGPWNYQSSDAMGLLEMLEWCEDLHIDPVLAVYAGFSLKGEKALGKDLQPFVQDALDEIEYVTGDASTKWGAQRAKDGHPAPFHVTYLEIGNEDDLDHSGSYEERYPPFEKAIRARYPDLKLIATTRVKHGTPDVIDDHFYRSPEEFYSMVHHYDTMDRKGPKIFVGEWATRTGSPTPNFDAALGDAAWMTSMERNSDLIIMSSYAPLFTNVSPGAMQWAPDLIGYDAMTAYGSPAYWAQVLFAEHLGKYVASTDAQDTNDRLFTSATVSADGHTLFLKVVNATDQPQAIDLNIPNAKTAAASTATLHAASRWATNSITQPNNIQPVKGTIAFKPVTKLTIPGNTIQALDIPLR